MTHTTKLIIGLGALATAAVASVRPACASECVSFTQDNITLELEGVSEDGVEVANPAGYDGFSLRLEGSPYDGSPDTVNFRLIATEGTNNTWIEGYQ